MIASYILVIIGLGNGLFPSPHQAMTSTNKKLLSIGPLGTNFKKFELNTQIVFK